MSMIVVSYDNVNVDGEFGGSDMNFFKRQQRDLEELVDKILETTDETTSGLRVEKTL